MKYIAASMYTVVEAVYAVMANGYGFPLWRGGPMHMISSAEEEEDSTHG